MSVPVTGGKLNQTQTVAMWYKPHGFAINRHDLTEIKVIGQVPIM
jgi:hypothetical protein